MNDNLLTDMGEGDNWDTSYAGAGPVDTAVQIVKSINDGDWLAASGNAVAAGLNLLSVIDSPLDVIGTSAMGWIIEHVRFLDGFLDNTVGDPVAIENAAAALSQAAVTLDGVAAEQFTAFNAEVPVYRSGASPSRVPFEDRVGPRAEELHLLSVQCAGLGGALIGAGMWVATIRGVMRDLLAEFAWWLLQRIAATMAAAPLAGGAPIGFLVADTVRGAAQTSGRLAAKLTECAENLSQLTAKIKQLAELMSTPRRATAASLFQNMLPSAGKAIDDLGDANQPSAYDKAREEAEPPPEPAELEPKLPEPDQPFSPIGQRGAAWRTSGTLDEP